MDQIGRAAKMATDWWVERLRKGDKERFAAVLQPLVEADLRATGQCTMEVDYDPREPLLTAVREVIDPECRGFMFSAKGIFPEKHSLDVTPRWMKPKEGYGNWTDRIIVPTE